MAQLPSLGQESINETFRIVIPGYFALFLVYTLYPSIFAGNTGIALALVGGVGLGIALYGMRLEKKIPVFKPKLASMLTINEDEKIETMLKIANAQKDKYPNLNSLKPNKFYADFWGNFSYSEVSEPVRERQRIYASTFYLYANCSIVLLGYILFLALSISSPSFSHFLSYKPNSNLDLAQILLAAVFSVLFWKKAKAEIEGSMSFQKTAMYWHKDLLCQKLSEFIELHKKVEKI